MRLPTITLIAFGLLQLPAKNLNAQHYDANGTRNYCIKDKSSNNSGYLNKYLPENIDTWKHAQERLDMYCLSRGSAVALNNEVDANSTKAQSIKAFIEKTNIVGAMNSGLMNKSWEFDDPAKWQKSWSGDVKVIKSLQSCGFKKVTMYMQSVLSKGNLVDFNVETGAPLSVRVEDCITYAKYIEANKPAGVEVNYALIDAFPAKGIGDKLDYRTAYYDLVKAFQRENIPFVGIMIDIKSNSVKNNTNALLDDCKWIETTLSDSVGQQVYSGWWAWDKEATRTRSNTLMEQAYTSILQHPNGKYCSHFAIGGTGENLLKSDDIIPKDIINGEFSLAGRLNMAFSYFELESSFNPLNTTDDIMGPQNIGGVDDISNSYSDPKVQLYPNPVSSILNINNTLPDDAHFVISSLNGKTVHEGVCVRGLNQIDASKLPNGFYVLQMQNDVTRISHWICIYR